MLFKIIWSIDAIAAVIVLYFFFIGLADGTVSNKNMGLWMAIVGGLIIIMAGSVWLKSNNYDVFAMLLLLVLTLPALFYLIYMLIAILGGGRWN